MYVCFYSISSMNIKGELGTQWNHLSSPQQHFKPSSFSFLYSKYSDEVKKRNGNGTKILWYNTKYNEDIYSVIMGTVISRYTCKINIQLWEASLTLLNSGMPREHVMSWVVDSIPFLCWQFFFFSSYFILFMLYKFIALYLYCSNLR